MQEFVQYIHEQTGMNPSHIEPGKWVKFPGIDKGNGNKAGYAYLFAHGLGGVYGDFASGIQGRWRHDKVSSFTPDQLIDFNRLIREAEEKSRIEQERSWVEYAEIARLRFERANPADPNHPYLKTKQVKAFDIRQENDLLLIPLFDATGSISTLQTIAPDGSKKLMYGGRKKGCAFVIWGQLDIVFVTEGYSTGVSVHEATGKTVIVAVDAGNLAPVCESLLLKNYNRIIIAADNDN